MFVLAIAAVILSAHCIAAQQTKPTTCSTADIDGPYGAALQGATTSGDLLGEGGQIIFDGQGKLSGTWIIDVNGQQISVPAHGTYSVSPGCLGKMTMKFQQQTIHFNLVVDPNQRLELIVTDSGVIQVGYAIPQGNATCTKAGLAGAWDWNSVGYQIGVGPGGFIGRVNFLANGKMSGTVTLSIDGQIVSDIHAGGTFTIQSTCMGTVTFEVAKQKQPTAVIVVVNGGSEILVPGALGAITATR
jgi:hypothetical protein